MSRLKERLLFMLLGAFLTIVTLVLIFYFLSRNPTAVAYTSVSLTGLHTATTTFHERTGQWPASLNELVTNSHNTIFYAPSPNGFRDGWKHPFIFELYTTNRGYGRILSYGRDGKPGGLGPNSDMELRFP
jgi:hypothetical protein